MLACLAVRRVIARELPGIIVATVMCCTPPNNCAQTFQDGQVSAEQQQGSAQRRSLLRFGADEKAGADTHAVDIEYVPLPNTDANQIDAEIVLEDPAWRFRKVESKTNKNLKLSVKERVLVRNNPEGGALRVSTLVLNVSSKQTIPAGTVGRLVFSSTDKQPGRPLSLTLRKAEAYVRDETAQRGGADNSPIEPPSPEAPINPATGCFFFTH